MYSCTTTASTLTTATITTTATTTWMTGLYWRPGFLLLHETRLVLAVLRYSSRTYNRFEFRPMLGNWLSDIDLRLRVHYECFFYLDRYSSWLDDKGHLSFKREVGLVVVIMFASCIFNYLIPAVVMTKITGSHHIDRQSSWTVSSLMSCEVRIVEYIVPSDYHEVV